MHAWSCQRRWITLRRDRECRLILVGREEVIRQYLPGGSFAGSFEPPPCIAGGRGMRRNHRVHVAEGLVDAGRHRSGERRPCRCVRQCQKHRGTDGPARFVLKTATYRPAGDHHALPAINGRTWVLDLGANVDCRPEHLFQFAVMGAELVPALEGIARPTSWFAQHRSGRDQRQRAGERKRTTAQCQ